MKNHAALNKNLHYRHKAEVSLLCLRDNYPQCSARKKKKVLILWRVGHLISRSAPGVELLSFSTWSNPHLIPTFPPPRVPGA